MSGPERESADYWQAQAYLARARAESIDRSGRWWCLVSGLAGLLAGYLWGRIL